MDVSIRIRLNSDTNVRVDQGVPDTAARYIRYTYGEIETAGEKAKRVLSWSNDVHSSSMLRIVFLQDMCQNATTQKSAVLSFCVQGVDIVPYLQSIIANGGVDPSNEFVSVNCESLDSIEPGDEIIIGPMGLFPSFVPFRPSAKFERQSRIHAPKQLWWRKYGRWMIGNDVKALAESPYKTQFLETITPHKAIFTLLHHSQSFKDFQFVLDYFNIQRFHVFEALLNGRKVNLPRKLNPLLLTELTEEIIEPYAFAWLVWAAAHFEFLPWSFLRLAFDNIPRVDKDVFVDGVQSLFDERCQSMVYSRNGCIACFAALDGRKVDCQISDDIYCTIKSFAVKFEDTKWLEAIEK